MATQRMDAGLCRHDRGRYLPPAVLTRGVERICLLEDAERLLHAVGFFKQRLKVPFAPLRAEEVTAIDMDGAGEAREPCLASNALAFSQLDMFAFCSYIGRFLASCLQSRSQGVLHRCASIFDILDQVTSNDTRRPPIPLGHALISLHGFEQT